MATPIFYDRVLETTTTTGTGTLTLAGAVTGFQTWAAIGNSLTSYYYIEGVDANGVPTGEWEVGLGTYTLSGTTLARTTVLKSSNSNNAVSLSAGTKRVGNSIPAGILNTLFNPPTCAVSRTTTQSISDNAATAVQFNVADDVDTHAMHDPASNNTKITIPTGGDGVYLLNGNATFAAASTGLCVVQFIINGGSNTTGTSGMLNNVSTTNRVAISVLQKLVAGDYIEFYIYQNSGGSININDAHTQVVRVSVG